MQFNDGGTAFGGDADYVWDKTANRLSLSLGTATAAYDLNFGGEAARQLGMLRRTTAASAGNALTINAGGATSAGTNLAGGTLNLAGGTATGTGTSKISFQVAGTTAAGALNTTGTTDGAPVERMALMGDGDFIVNGGASGYTGTASVPATGAGTRMFFDVQKAAFRAGDMSTARNGITPTLAITAWRWDWTRSPAAIRSTAMGCSYHRERHATALPWAGTTASGNYSTSDRLHDRR